MRRRRYLTSLTSLGAIGVAGCTGGGEGEEGPGPEATGPDQQTDQSGSGGGDTDPTEGSADDSSGPNVISNKELMQRGWLSFDTYEGLYSEEWLSRQGSPRANNVYFTDVSSILDTLSNDAEEIFIDFNNKRGSYQWGSESLGYGDIVKETGDVVIFNKTEEEIVDAYTNEFGHENVGEENGWQILEVPELEIFEDEKARLGVKDNKVVYKSSVNLESGALSKAHSTAINVFEGEGESLPDDSEVARKVVERTHNDHDVWAEIYDESADRDWAYIDGEIMVREEVETFHDDTFDETVNAYRQTESGEYAVEPIEEASKSDVPVNQENLVD